MKFYLKYMVSLRCKIVVETILKKLDLPYNELDLGMVEFREVISPSQRKALKQNLYKFGLELLDDKTSLLIEKIKTVIFEMMYYQDQVPKVDYSDYISEKLGNDYTYLSGVFSEVHGISIQRFIILHKIERAKELLLYDKLNLAEIAGRLHYSSAGHLSTQFKKVTGLSPSFFKQVQHKRKSNSENT